jgi:hypothetical protein
MSTASINLADAIRILRLEADHDTRTRALRLLGFEWRESVEDSVAKELESNRKRQEYDATSDRPLGVERPAPPRRSEAIPNEAWLGEIHRPIEWALPGWYRQTTALPRDTRPVELLRPKVESLFAPEQQRATLLALVSRILETQQIDISKAVRRIADLATLTRLPYRKKPSVRRGVQLLLDVGPRMDPFADDREQLVSSLLRLLAPEMVHIVRCYGWPPDDPKTQLIYGEYRRPTPGTPALLVSEVGEGEGIFAPVDAEADDWIAFAQRLSTYGCELIVLAPISRERLSLRARRHLTIVPWDRRQIPYDLILRLRQFRTRA